jgi:RNA polymerase-binding transcription factor DksA
MATTPAKKASAKSAPAKKAAAKKAAAKKATARKAAARKATARKATARKATARKATGKKATGKKAPVKEVTGKKSVTNATATKAAPARKKGPVVLDKFQEAQKEVLLEERERLIRHSEALKAEADSLAADREAGDTQFDEESGEGDTLAVERERDLVLSAQAQQTVAEIDHALAKLEAGTYGICEVSGQPIPRERLKAIPWARERVEYKATGFIR